MLGYAPRNKTHRFSAEAEWSDGITGGSSEEAESSGVYEPGPPLPGDGSHLSQTIQRHDAARAASQSAIKESGGSSC